MGERKTIPLKKPLQGPNGLVVKEIVLREPTFDEYLENGDPYTVAASQSGIPFMVENADVISKYVNICVVEPKDPQILRSQGGARVAREIKEALLSFFHPDAPAEEDLATSQTNSSSEASGDAVATTSEG